MNPLVVLDIETTGTDKNKDWIVQFSAIKVNRDTNKIIETLDTYVRPSAEYHMSIGAFLKHHIHPDTLKDKPTFRDIAINIYNFLQGCDILTYNGISFDLPFLMNEFNRIGMTWRPSDHVCYDAYREEQRRNSNKLTDTFHRYCGRTMEEAGLTAHNSLSDVKATYAVFRHQLQDSEVKIEEMLTDDNWVSNVDFDGETHVTFCMGRYKDVPVKIVKQVDPNYITWLLSTNVCDKTRQILNNILNEN